MPMWVQAASRGSPPPARSSHTLCEVQGNLILFGGEAQPRVPVPPDTFVFDAARQTWITVSLEGESPSARVGHSAASIGSCMLLFGGRTGVEGGTAMNDLHSLDLAARCWHCLASEGSKPQPRSYHSATSLASCLYIFGGCGADGRLNDLWCYDSEANSWAQLPHSEQIKPRGGAGFASAGGSLYVIGGFCGNELADVHAFEIANRVWTQLTLPENVPQLPPRSVFGIAVVKLPGSQGDALVVFGGEVEPTDKGHAGAGSYSNDLFALHLAAPQAGWQDLGKLPSKPSPRGWFAATVFAGGLAVHGGNAPSNERLDDMFVLQLHDNS